MAGDIWSTGAFSFESPLKDLLDSGDYTTEQLLAEDELLQEIRGLHPQLISFFSTPEAVTKLVRYVILPSEESQTNDGNGKKTNRKDPGDWLKEHLDKNENDSKMPENDPEIKHVRFPYMACEIICCEIDSIIDVLVDGKVATEEQKLIENQPSKVNDETSTDDASSDMRILDLLFSLLYDTKSGELDDYRAGYFDKILTVLFRKRPEDLVNFINEGGASGTHALMESVFSHLYSHSIMQIAQRLMLPKRPTPPQPPPEDNGAEIIAEEHQLEDDLAVYCNWSQSNDALNMLLNILTDPKPPSAPMSKEENDEFKLDMSLNASEVLITVIQNSMLSSETMLSLTKSETIKRLVLAATTIRCEDGEESFFSPHESLLTSAMNVLESLILQLGGYGAVGTMFLLPEEEGGQLMEGAVSEDHQHLIADLESVLEHLPLLLSEMSNLLRHPSTKKWRSFMQFSRSEPQPLLGNSRLRIVRVLESLVLLGDAEVDAMLVQSDCLEICLNLFWDFQWCSMLHQSVANLLVHVFEGHNARFAMQEYFLIKCNLLGRLMESFMELQEEDKVSEVVSNLENINVAGTAGESDKSITNDPLLVSEDDVEAAIEKQELEDESSSSTKQILFSNVEELSTNAVQLERRDTSTIGAAAPSQSFRFGYMGHVIIICQALVHACATEVESEEQMLMQNGGSPESPPPEETEPLLLAELVANHALSERWTEFISTTLASETVIQSTPLGGYGSGQDPLHAHRPGLADDDDIDDDNMGPPVPPRGIGGFDMDENDLDIAASIMSGFSLSQHRRDGDAGSNDAGSLGSGDSERSYNSGETASERSGYAFDDPLGKAGSLGIELGKLTKYKESSGQTSKDSGSGYAFDDPLGKAGSLGIELGKLTKYKESSGQTSKDSGDVEDDDTSSGSSSDDEQISGEGSDEVPVMDLFAGNFDYNQTDEDVAKQPQVAEFTDFAKFDEVDEDFGEFVEAAPPTSQETESSSSSPEDIFDKGDHAELLETEIVEDNVDKMSSESDELGHASGETTHVEIKGTDN
ncbi:serine/threonine-protein phosphatase 6 regulatory subunit 3 [Fistulifera solaris]|uniref:Serine/threonine-protein phosphatase 6 regulatory subunit 3 n=1 Tax=Fistulifera solaris TaxID=1519565 RepID=A0A1Z5JRR9_FISSO|nr:serine/threonine-protein phosphatase 6 regulatory subunit 3 [Fistulifera solaris]|eukprot:GAX16733.1 serine/threonine-protein phosphatase 6 regulatory subunit 3 [Fistulifera solaris]